jgi:hypothetical protein
MHVESESKIKLETGVEITKAANGSAPDPKNLRYYGSGQLRQYGSNRIRWNGQNGITAILKQWKAGL